MDWFLYNRDLPQERVDPFCTKFPPLIWMLPRIYQNFLQNTKDVKELSSLIFLRILKNIELNENIGIKCSILDVWQGSEYASETGRTVTHQLHSRQVFHFRCHDSRSRNYIVKRIRSQTLLNFFWAIFHLALRTERCTVDEIEALPLMRRPLSYVIY